MIFTKSVFKGMCLDVYKPVPCKVCVMLDTTDLCVLILV